MGRTKKRNNNLDLFNTNLKAAQQLWAGRLNSTPTWSS